MISGDHSVNAQFGSQVPDKISAEVKAMAMSRVIFTMADNAGRVTKWATEFDAIEAASALVKAAGYPVDVREYHDFTFVTADPRSGRNVKEIPYFSIKALPVR